MNEEISFYMGDNGESSQMVSKCHLKAIEISFTGCIGSNTQIWQRRGSRAVGRTAYIEAWTHERA